MTAVTTMRMRILLVMTTTTIVALPHVFAGDVSVSRHFKGDIFSQEGNSQRFWWLQHKTIHIWGAKSHRGVWTEKLGFTVATIIRHSPRTAHLIKLQSDLF